MAYRSVSNWRETATAKTTEAGEAVRRTYLWERNEKDYTEALENLAELQNIMLRAEQIWEDVPKEIKLKFDNDVEYCVNQLQ